MAYELNGIKLAFTADHLVMARKRNGQNKWVLVEADSKEAGKTMAMYLSAAYKATEIRDYSGGYRDFSLVFDTKERADAVLRDLLASTSDYLQRHPDLVGYELDEDQDDMPTTTNTSEEPELEPEKPDYTTYIVIGAAAAIILLLLWDGKK